MTLPRIDDALVAWLGTNAPHTLTQLAGDASSRIYYRLTFEQVSAPTPQTPTTTPPSAIVMQLPENAFVSDEGGETAPTATLPFIEIAELLRTRRVRVPQIYAEDLPNRVVLLEDLGPETFEARLIAAPAEQWSAKYETAVNTLAQMHERCGDLPATSVVGQRAYDTALLQWELEHFRQWGLEALFGTTQSADAQILETSFAKIVNAIEAFPTGFVHRDYQSRNLMWHPRGDLVVIDFQDALVGPRIYDLVALLCDSYVDLPAALQRHQREHYADQMGIDHATAETEFNWVTVHRKLKDAGRFVYIDRVRHNPGFLQWFPQSLRYVGRALQQLPELGDLDALLRRSIPGYPDEVAVPESSSE